ncbi:hypothetical protein ACF0H5_022926 [Mactra antiquata]
MSDTRPERAYLDDPTTVWRDGIKPDYSVVDRKYMAERSTNHKPGSLERIVENLVKTWESESAHKLREEDWKSVDKENFYISANGGHKYSLKENMKLGNYNMFLDECPLYNAAEETHESSHKLFRETFKSGYPWEVLQVFSGPPVVSFTWRHWGTFEGDYKGTKATGETIEMFGSCVARVTEDLKIQSIDVYYDPNGTLMKLTKGSKCPFKH